MSSPSFSITTEDLANAIKYGCKPTDTSLRVAIRSIICWEKFREALQKRIDISDQEFGADLQKAMYRELFEICDMMIGNIFKLQEGEMKKVKERALGHK